jgi:hypothetical protein
MSIGMPGFAFGGVSGGADVRSGVGILPGVVSMSSFPGGGGGTGGGLLDRPSAGTAGMPAPFDLPGGAPNGSVLANLGAAPSGSVLANLGGAGGMLGGAPGRGGPESPGGGAWLGAGRGAMPGAAAVAGAGGGLLSEGGGGGGLLERPGAGGGGALLGGGGGALADDGGGMGPRDGEGAELRLGGGNPVALRPAAASGLASPSSVF